MNEKQITKSDIYEIYKYAASKTIVNENIVLERVDGILANFRDNDFTSVSDYIDFCAQLIMMETKKQITFLVEDKLSEFIGEEVSLVEKVGFKKWKKYQKKIYITLILN